MNIHFFKKDDPEETSLESDFYIDSLGRVWEKISHEYYEPDFIVREDLEFEML